MKNTIMLLRMSGLSVLVLVTSPWLPEPANINLNDIRERYDTFYLVDQSGVLSGDMTQDTLSFDINYGLSDHLMLDFHLGYTQTECQMGRDSRFEALNDTQVGIRRRIVGCCYG